MEYSLAKHNKKFKQYKTTLHYSALERVQQQLRVYYEAHLYLYAAVTKLQSVTVLSN